MAQGQPFFQNDLEVLNYALTLEHLEANFYQQVNGAGVLDGDAAEYFRIIGDHEQTHVDALTQAISDAGGTPVQARASYDFSPLGDLSTREGILTAAETLEQTGVAAYNGAASEIMDQSILATAGSIVQVEANHVAIVRTIISPDTTPVGDAFAPATPPQEILNTIQPLLGPEQ